MSKIFLTGATGLLGSHLCERSLLAGHELTVLVSSIPKRSFLGTLESHAKLRILFGELQNPKEWQSQLESYDAVIHCAGKASIDPLQRQEVWKINFEGTQNAYNALRGHFDQWVQISSISTMCDGGTEAVNESFQGRARKTFYAESKLAADEWIQKNEKNALIIHPCYMLGRWDSKPSSGSIFAAVRFKKIQQFIAATKNFVAAEDVATGILQAIQKKSQGHYILGNENTSIKNFFQLLNQEMHMPFEMQEIALLDTSEAWLKEFCAASSVNWNKAKDDFAYKPKINLQEMLKDTMDYFEKYKMLKRLKSPQG